MNRKQAKKLSEESQRTLEERMRRKIVITQETWNHVNNQQLYEPEDIVAVASCLADTHGYDITQQLKVLDGEGQLKVWLESVKNFDVHQNAYFCIYYIQANHWVVFSFLEFESEIVILYKDSQGGDILPEIKKAISERYSKNKLLFKSNIKNNTNGGGCCGLMCLKNFEVILENLNKRKGEFLAQFESVEYSPSPEVTNIREKFKEILFIYITENILLSVDELQRDQEYIVAMKALIMECVRHTVTSGPCQQIINEFKAIENEPNPNTDKLNEARRNVLESDYVKELIEKSSLKMSDDSTEMINFTQHKIEEKFPEQSKTFQQLFSWIMKFKDNTVKDDFLKALCNALCLTYEDMKIFFEDHRTREEKEENAQLTEDVDSLKIRSVEELEEILPPLQATSQNICEENVKTIEELLKELSLGDSWDSWGSNCNEHKNCFPGKTDRQKLQTRHVRKPPQGLECKKQLLRESVSRVFDAWNQRWREASAMDIRKWAEDRRSCSSQMNQEEISKEDVEETLAVIRRAHQLTIKGELLRETQLLAALVCLLGKTGTLCQMATGEGKTGVIAMLAAANVLLYNEQVDIITTNHVLANDGFKSCRIFFELLGITSSCNASQPKDSKTRSGGGARACYTADVLYGDMATFQFDYLQHKYHQLGTRGNRTFGRVIVDEVDSMLIDNASHIAKVASPFPGMDFLRYVYIKIWQKACKAEHGLFTEALGGLVTEEQELIKEENGKKIKINEQQLQKESNNVASRVGLKQGQINGRGKQMCKKGESKLKNTAENVTEEEIVKIKQIIKESKPTQIDLIPAHLRDYASQMEDKWIDSALYAKYHCHKNEQYVLRIDEESKEMVVIPVDYMNTGVTLKTTQWSNGLHQFVQLKEDLRMTVESLTSSFISNVSYIKLFGKKTWGVTGTLGSDAETQLLSDVYKVSHAKIPMYKPKNFTETAGICCLDKNWGDTVSLNACIFAGKMGGQPQRSVLIICKTIKDVLELKRTIKIIVKVGEQEANIKIKTYYDETSSKIVEGDVGPGEIIIATNIAGRGTDLRTTDSLQENGGLHVIVAFLPANQRVEDQAFGRTSRQGNAGSAQIILRHSDVLELGLDISPEMNFSAIKEKRDRLEQIRIQEVRDHELTDIDFEDALSLEFIKVYGKLILRAVSDNSVWFLAMDLKERWAFWLNEKDFRRNRSSKTVNEEFQDFLTKASKILGDENNNGGEISFNPYYSVLQAEYFMKCGSNQKCEKALWHAIDLGSKNSSILPSAFYKLFEIEVEKGSQIRERAIKALRHVFFINPDKEKDETYKTKAKEALEKAKEGLEKELTYMNDNFDMKKLEEEENGNNGDNDSNNIRSSLSHTSFLKQLLSRYTVLNFFCEHVKSLSEQIQKSLNTEDGSTVGLGLVSRVPLEELTAETNSPLSQVKEMEEIGQLGLETIYCLREIHDVEDTIIRSAQVQIFAGLGIASTGALFPPALVITTSLASILISEGICDIVLKIISKGYDKFSKADYIRGKVIAYAISLGILGVAALARCLSILDEAIKYCKYAVDFLRKCPKMKFVLGTIANLIERLQKYFEKLRMLGLIYKSRTAIALSTKQVFYSAFSNTLQRTTRNVLGSVITERIVNVQLGKMFTVVLPEIQDCVRKGIREHIKEDDLKHTTKSELQTLTNSILNNSGIFQVLHEVISGLTAYSGNWDIKLGALVVDSGITGYRIYTYPKKFCNELKKQLENKRKTEKESGESFEDLQVIIIETVSQKIYFLSMQILGKFANRLVVNQVTDFIWGSFDCLGKQEKKVENQIDEILYAYQLLGLECGATDEEINSACRVYNEPSEGNNGNTNGFHEEARDLLLNVNRMVASFKYEKIENEGDMIEFGTSHFKNDVIRALYLQSRTELLLG